MCQSGSTMIAPNIRGILRHSELFSGGSPFYRTIRSHSANPARLAGYYFFTKDEESLYVWHYRMGRLRTESKRTKIRHRCNDRNHGVARPRCPGCLDRSPCSAWPSPPLGDRSARRRTTDAGDIERQAHRLPDI